MSADEPERQISLRDRQEAARQIVFECIRRREAGEDLPDQQIVAEHRELMPELAEELGAAALIRRARGQVEAHSDSTSTGLPDDPVGPEDLKPEHLPGYQILRELHRGGQGVVYRALQESTNRVVAVKVMLAGPLADRQARLRFQREVKLVASFKHPNIVVVHDSGVARGQHYFAMDYIDGFPLDTAVAVSSLAVPEIIRLFAQVCDAVAYAHRRGVIHRDLKPSNVLVGLDGTPYVVDFGLAKTVSEEWHSRHQWATYPGHILGTLPYMSPEQTSGEPDAVDSRTDVYSLGVMLYELLTGSKPYDVRGDVASVVQRIREADPPRPSRAGETTRTRGINSELDAIVLKALEKEPARRYQSVSELQDDLNAWLERRPVQARSASSLYMLRKIVMRHSFESVLVGTLIVSLVSFVSIALHSQLQAREALEDKARSDRAFLHLNSDFEEASIGAQESTAENLFGWFLAEWYAGRRDRAREIQSLAAGSAPDHAAIMRYLLEDERWENVRSRLAPEALPLLHFARGERLLREGRSAQAIASFRRSVSPPASPWLRSSAEARLQQLLSAAAASQASRPEGASGDSHGR